MTRMQAPLDDVADELRQLATVAGPAVQARPDLARVVLGRARRQRHSRVRRVVTGAGAGLLILIALPAVSLLGHSDYYTVTEPSALMESTVHIGDRVVFNRKLPVARGDLVHVQLTNEGEDFDTIERVLAMAGDTIGCPAAPDGRCAAVVVNGTPVPEPYASITEPFPTSVVPAHTVYLLGDHRAVAVDSRIVGPVDLTRVHGVAVEILDRGGRARAVPGAPAHPGPGDHDNVDPAGPVPPAKAK